jgi:hypothetical protein
MLSDDGTLIVKDLFGKSVNPDRCLVQTRYQSVLTLTIEDKSRNKRVVCQAS